MTPNRTDVNQTRAPETAQRTLQVGSLAMSLDDELFAMTLRITHRDGERDALQDDKTLTRLRWACRIRLMRWLAKASKLLLSLLLATACGGEDGFKPASPPESIEAAPGSTEFESDLEFLKVHLPEASEAELRERIALRKILASRGIEKGLTDDFGVSFAYRRALAQSQLKKKFETEHSPDGVPMDTWEKLYWNRNILPKFDHHDTYFVLDVQMICCQGSVDLCEKDPLVQDCLRDTEPDMWTVFKELKHKGFTDPVEIKKYVRDELKLRYTVRTQEYSFQYQFDKSHEEQQGYTIINRNVAFAARGARVGELAEPVRSNFGWHVVFVKDFMPELHLQFGDEKVMETLKTELYARVLVQDVDRYFVALLKKARVAVFKERLRDLDWSHITGLK